MFLNDFLGFSNIFWCFSGDFLLLTFLKARAFYLFFLEFWKAKQKELSAVAGS